MWEFYLASSEIAFRYFGFMNFQIQLTKRVDALPITRDYMFEPGPSTVQEMTAERTAAE
jgi:cyclopropane-fatty-acyl-phospholipid synthase